MNTLTLWGVTAGMALATSAVCNSCESPEWSPLPDVGLSQGETRSFDLDDYLRDPNDPNADLQVTVNAAGGVSAVVDSSTHLLTLTGNQPTSGEVTLELTATDPGGCSATTTLLVKVHANRDCNTTFLFAASSWWGSASNIKSVAVAGTFNGWSTTANLLSPVGGGQYSGTFEIDPGNYQYKYVVNGTDWLMDSGNPLTAWDGGFENSEVHVPDCRQPELEPTWEVDGSTGALEATIRFVDGADGSGPDPESIQVSSYIGDRPRVTFDDFNRTVQVSLTGLEPGKHSLMVSASSLNGQPAEPLYLPIWVEAESWDWKNAVLYFAFTDRFANGNPGNDITIQGAPYQSNYQGGDFAGITQKIEAGYFTDLGINAIWLSPQFNNTNNAEWGEVGQLYSGYHGYWPVSADGIEPAFGTPEELKALVKAAHERGIRILFDLVANHVHNQHPYYAEHSADWFNDYWLCGENDGWNQNPIGCWFAPYLPDLDYKNPDALHTMVNDALDAIKEYDVDGFRVDAVKHMENAYLNHLSTFVSREIEHESLEPVDQFYLVGETFVGEWDYNCSQNPSCSQDLMKRYIAPDLLDGQFDFTLFWQILKTFARNEASMADLEYMLEQNEAYWVSEDPDFDIIMSNFLGNHDVARFISHANGDIDNMWGNGAKEQGWYNPPGQPSSAEPYQRLRLAYVFLASIKGVPLVYYGDEIGLAGAGDPDNRRMMYFGSDLSALQQETLEDVSDVMRLRGDHKTLASADRLPLLGNDPDVLVYAKTGNPEGCVVAMNRSKVRRTVSVNTGGMGLEGNVLFNLEGANAQLAGDTLTFDLPPFGAAIVF